MARANRAYVVQVGCGNTGSHTAPMIARQTNIERITVIDPDRYETHNVRNQAIGRNDVGRNKVDCVYDLIKAANPDVEISAIAGRVEDVPLGALRADVLACCVDNRETRRYLNEAAVRLGLTWVNAAVDESMIARVDAYHASETEPCMQCPWDEEQYATMSQHFPCNLNSIQATRSNTTIEVGAIAAAVQANEVRKVLDGDTHNALIGRQMMLEIRAHAHHLTRFRRNPRCRLDHRPWTIDTIDCDPATTRLEQLFEIAGGEQATSLSLFGQQFATRLDCIECRRQRDIGLAIIGRLDAQRRTCDCGAQMLAAGFYIHDALQRHDIGGVMQRELLVELGFEAGDVVSVTMAAGACRHIQLGSYVRSRGGDQ